MLDEKQKEVVESKEPNILVVAGAGSGKTLCLTERIKYLLNTDVAPSGIVAITFTNMAAEEMKERLANVNGIGDCFIGTIHSFANKILKNSNEHYTLYTDEVDLKYHIYLIGKYCKNLTIERYAEYCKLRTLYEMGRVTEDEIDNFFDKAENVELRCINRSIETVQEYINNGGSTYVESIETLMKRDNCITFDELLEKSRDYFSSLNIRINHLLVDEFQDIGNLEWRFIQSLNAYNNFFIGDDYQAIYGFKGSNVSIFTSLANNEKYKVYILENNYRNSRKILSIASEVIRQVPDRIDKKSIPHNTNSGIVMIKNKYSLKDCLHDIKCEGSYKDWFILTRSNKELYYIVQQCEDLGIPHDTFKREGMSLAELKKRMENDTVKILTVHSSKGLENKNVLLYGNFPVQCPKYRKNDEERRVMYVGITRAIDKLLILNG